LLASVMLAVGVRVAVQVMPPSLLLRLLRRAVGHGEVAIGQPGHRFAEGDGDRGALAHRQRRVGTTMVAVGRWVSMA
jgi:hypothetical protein